MTGVSVAWSVYAVGVLATAKLAHRDWRKGEPGAVIAWMAACAGVVLAAAGVGLALWAGVPW